ncbi:MAG: hypothetical protein HFP77_04515 [Methylococcales symbiont of Iophon sp. n. MRB-2018]|nr:MAG: hypothetical protein HFP77_04515 [Methylococcales symbiont of Iophon sp. n. MRB-2018]KAF3980035.1 MAG: hypothetical protein HFP76_04175 [Methylococcales symbiont of Iophon sp. n. MRB-2018]
MLEFLPVKQDLETKGISKKSISANRALAILNETAKNVPNRFILINALTLQEAKDSSEIENIITTQKYLQEIERLGIFENIKIKNSDFYINISLLKRLRKGI